MNVHSFLIPPPIFFKLFSFLLAFLLSFSLAALGLCCYARAFSSCGEQGSTLRCGAQASHCSGSSFCRAQALCVQASVVVTHGLSSCGSRALERSLSSCGIRT